MYSLKSLIQAVQSNQTKIDNEWLPTRPEIYHSWIVRLKDGWEVFRGRADAVCWPGGNKGNLVRIVRRVLNDNPLRANDFRNFPGRDGNV